MDIHESLYISALQGGSAEAFKALYCKYADRIYSFAIKQIKNRTAAQDIVQETFMQLWKSRMTLDPEKGVQAFLFTITRHIVIDTFRRQIVEVDFEGYLEYCEHRESTSSIEEKLYYDEFQQKINCLKKKLSRRECEIFEMSREGNMTVKEIANALQLSQQTVKNYITSSLKLFRSSLLEHNT